MSALHFAIGDDHLELPASSVCEVARPPRISALPGAAAAVLGVANLRGAIIPVISGRALLGLPAAEQRPETVVVIVERGQRKLALLVDRALEEAPAGRGARDLDELLASLAEVA
jgi:purine-binding chemotaxis protein CheW